MTFAQSDAWVNSQTRGEIFYMFYILRKNALKSFWDGNKEVEWKDRDREKLLCETHRRRVINLAASIVMDD